jgi:hypothetical protein
MAAKPMVVGIRLKLSAAFMAVSLVIAGFVIGAIDAPPAKYASSPEI